MSPLQRDTVVLYAVYAVSALLQFYGPTIMIGLVALLAAYGVGTAKKKAAVNTPYESHLQWLSRTFWIGSAVIVPIAVLIASGLILALTDLVTILNTAQAGDPGALMGAINAYMAQNFTKIALITLATTLPTAGWWLGRCWRGYTLAKQGKPVEKVMSWLV